MTRMEEYNALLQELEETPDRLNFTVARAKARTRRQRVRKWVGAPLISLSAACCAFVLLVNFSTPFAMACAKAKRVTTSNFRAVLPPFSMLSLMREER